MKKVIVPVLLLLITAFFFGACVDIDEALPHYNVPNAESQNNPNAMR